MKRLAFALLMLSLVACAPAGGDAASTADATTEGRMTTSQTATAPATQTETAVSPAPAQEEKPMSEYQNKVAVLQTTMGDITIKFYPDAAPNHVRNFVDLAQKGFYDGTKFHRVIAGFMIQGGDPNTKSGDPSTWGIGGNGDNRVKAEFNNISHKRGIVSMARANHPDSASSQFFIVVADSTFLDRQYSVFGEVVSGMDVADKIVTSAKGSERPAEPVTLTKVTVRDAKP